MIHFVRVSPRHWLYYGTEDDVPDARRVDPFFFIEENAPFRLGNGWRWKRHDDLALHVGIAKKNPLATSDIKILGGSVIEASPEEIGLWGAEESEADAGEGPPEAGEGQHVGGAELR